jgi:Tfp pilus assembly protein PilX
MKRRSDRGSVLITVIVVLMLVSIGGLLLTITLQDYARMLDRQRDEMRAFHAAEAGGCKCPAGSTHRDR